MSRELGKLDITGCLFLNRCMNEAARQPHEHVILTSVAGQSADVCFARVLPWFDAILARAAEQPLPFFWATTDLQNPEDDDPGLVFQDPLRRYGIDMGIDCGWAVPVHDASGRVTVMNFTGSRDFTQFKLTIESHRATLHATAIYLHAHVCKVKNLRNSAPEFELTPRERQCLEWAAQGKSRSDIGLIIGLSPRTVKFHLENAQRKLNVARTTQAVLRAAALGLITVPAIG
jgi:LuxR family transcriptional activator of conjugal transfer of Ti plasmids